MKQGNTKAGTAVPAVKLSHTQRKEKAAAVQRYVDALHKDVMRIYNDPAQVKSRMRIEKMSLAKERQKEKELLQLIRDEIKAVVTSWTFIRALKQSLKA